MNAIESTAQIASPACRSSIMLRALPSQFAAVAASPEYREAASPATSRFFAASLAIGFTGAVGPGARARSLL
jgi:hypothetical protein